MPRRNRLERNQLDLLEARVVTAPCVEAVRAKVRAWQEGGYPGVTDTTRILLNHWFKTDHRTPAGARFAYHPFQREAIETLIYLYEVAKVRRQKALVEAFATRRDLRLLQYDDFARYCVKMATGSGKTKVMSLAIAWQYFNAVAEARDDFARAFLLLAPNVIVFERLTIDFAGGHIFRVDPIIPEELRIYWDFQCYMRGEGERAGSLGALYLTNIQQLYERAERNDAEPDVMTAVLGPRPPETLSPVEPFESRIARRDGPVVVLNDEAHHTHDEESEWNAAIRRVHSSCAPGLCAQLDFTATPRHSKGELFTWTVFDYPLKQAIIDNNVVKRPLKGIARGITEQRSDIAHVRYQAYLTAGVERWREYRKLLEPLSRKPVLFVMMNDTAAADDVGDWLRRKYPEDFAGDRLLVIHTDKTGEVTKKELDKARKTAREIDLESSPVNCIVSVLMLREGWDVRSVTVIVGLRPYTSKANILPEQTVGRGLRLMFPGAGGGYVERVDIIGNDAFIDFVGQLERDENLHLDTFDLEKDRVVIVTIQPEPAKADRDIAIPVLSPLLARKKSLAGEIAALDVSSLPCPVLPVGSSDRTADQFRYEGYDLVSLQKLIERDYRIPEPQTAEEIIGYYAQRIAQDLKLPSQFAALVPKVREFLETRAFGRPVDLRQPAMVRAIGTQVAAYVTVTAFAAALKTAVVTETEPRLVEAARPLSATPPFPWSRPTASARKTVFNLVPCDNEYEKAFAGFLERADDVERFGKLPPAFGFAIEYTDGSGNLRYYEPDFVAIDAAGVHWLLETKGLEDVDVAARDRAAALWCENASRLAGRVWRYRKVRQAEFEALRPERLADLGAGLLGPP